LDYVQAFNPATCELGDKIDLPITEANASSIKASGDTLLVIAQRLESYAATKPGLLIRINASTKTIIDTIQLKLYNPHSSVLSKGKLYVSSIDDFFAFENAGIEVVNLATGTSEILVTGAQLGGGAQGIALDEASQILYVSVYADWGDAPVKPVNLTSKAVGTALPNITDAANGLVFDSETGKLFVANTDGLKIYDTKTKTTTDVNEGANALPPYSLAIAKW
jgi:DNA-binding beta-propeller fold protein YncE